MGKGGHTMPEPQQPDMPIDTFIKIANSTALGIAAALLAWVIIVGYPAREKQFSDAIALERREYVAALLDSDKRSSDRINAIENRCYAQVDGNRKLLEEILDRLDSVSLPHPRNTRD
jgi:hypothetical protein